MIADDLNTNKDKKESISSSFPSSSAYYNEDKSNKNDNGELRSPEELRQMVHELLPFALDDQDNKKMTVHAFGYGSGVLSQKQGESNDQSKAVVDVILVVRDAEAFHRANIHCNPHHYTAGLRSPQRAAWWQRHQLRENPYLRNPGVYFVVTPNLKYGIVQYDDLCDDLQNWTCLYLAGRLHKPVVTIWDDDTINRLQHQHNLPAALAAALLLQYNDDYKQKKKIDALQNQSASPISSLYSVIASLSYQGDPRLTLAAEDPNKIAQLVAPQHSSRWQALYADAMLDLQKAGIFSIDNNNFSYRWDMANPQAHHCLWQSLPHHVRHQCGYHPPNNNHNNNFSLCVSAAQALPVVLASAIVAPAARYQSFKGLWTAGWTQSARYAYRKWRKGGGGNSSGLFR